MDGTIHRPLQRFDRKKKTRFFTLIQHYISSGFLIDTHPRNAISLQRQDFSCLFCTTVPLITNKKSPFNENQRSKQSHKLARDHLSFTTTSCTSPSCIKICNTTNSIAIVSNSNASHFPCLSFHRLKGNPMRTHHNLLHHYFTSDGVSIVLSNFCIPYNREERIECYFNLVNP